MPDLQEAAVVTEDIREQAEKLGGVRALCVVRL